MDIESKVLISLYALFFKEIVAVYDRQQKYP